MELALVVAIVRRTELETIERALQGIGVRGMTVSNVRGFGEYANFFRPDWMTDEVKIEVFAPRENVEQITGAILDASQTGSPGDGIVAVLPVHSIISARTQADALQNWIRA